LPRELHTLEDFLTNVHKMGYNLIEYNNNRVPCLLVEPKVFESIMRESYGKPNLIDTNLNIYDDGHHVFVNLNVNFLKTNLEFDFLLYANDTIDFFESLAASGMLGIAPYKTSTNNIFFVQLPRRENAENALDLIRSKLK
jgi:hypothetical protein